MSKQISCMGNFKKNYIKKLEGLKLRVKKNFYYWKLFVQPENISKTAAVQAIWYLYAWEWLLEESIW